MRTWQVLKFLNASGKIGGGSVIFAIVLFMVAIWEHYRQKNIPASLLIAAGITFFCYGCYIAWLKELQEKEHIVSSLEKPDIKLDVVGSNYRYDAEKDVTVFFLAASVINKGHPTSIINWHIKYEFGGDVEFPDMPHLESAYTMEIGGYELVYTNDDLLSIKCRETYIQKGQVVDGRLLYVLPRDRMDQQRSGIVRVTVSCFDYTGVESKAIFIPSSVPPANVLKRARETVRIKGAAEGNVG
jgi:hypothetical protein